MISRDVHLQSPVLTCYLTTILQWPSQIWSFEICILCVQRCNSLQSFSHPPSLSCFSYRKLQLPQQSVLWLQSPFTHSKLTRQLVLAPPAASSTMAYGSAASTEDTTTLEKIWAAAVHRTMHAGAVPGWRAVPRAISLVASAQNAAASGMSAAI